VLSNRKGAAGIGFISSRKTKNILIRSLKSITWSAPLKRMRVLYEGSHKEIFDDQKAKTTHLLVLFMLIEIMVGQDLSDPFYQPAYAGNSFTERIHPGN